MANRLVLTNKTLTMRATIKTVGEYHDAGVFRLKVDCKDHTDFGCNDCTNVNEVIKSVGEARRHLHDKLDIAIDAATADFLKSKLKTID